LKKKEKRIFNYDLQNIALETKDRATHTPHLKPWVNAGAPEG